MKKKNMILVISILVLIMVGCSSAIKKKPDPCEGKSGISKMWCEHKHK